MAAVGQVGDPGQRLGRPGRPGAAVDAPGIAQAPGRGLEVAAGELEEIRRRGDRPGRRVGDPGPGRRAVGTVDAQPLVGSEPEDAVDLGDRGDPGRRQPVLLAESAPEPVSKKETPSCVPIQIGRGRPRTARARGRSRAPGCVPRVTHDSPSRRLTPRSVPTQSRSARSTSRAVTASAASPVSTRAAARSPPRAPRAPWGFRPRRAPAVDCERGDGSRERPGALAGRVGRATPFPRAQAAQPPGVPTQTPPSASAARAVTAAW